MPARVPECLRVLWRAHAKARCHAWEWHGTRNERLSDGRAGMPSTSAPMGPAAADELKDA